MSSTYGARVMFSTPPAMNTSPSPALIAWAALAAACNPEPQRRFTVWPGTSTGSPARSRAMRATLRLSSPAWLAQPRMTSSIDAGSIPERSTTALMGTAARSSGRTVARDPPCLPTGVRKATLTYASRVTFPVSRFPSQRDPHRLRLEVTVQGFTSEVSAKSRCLKPAKRRARIVEVVRVDPNCAGANRLRRAMRLLDVLRPDSSGEAVDRVIRELHALLEIVAREHREHAVKDRGFDVIALAVGLRRLPTSHELSPFVHTLLDVGEHGLLLFLGDEGAEPGVLIERIAGGHLLGALGELLDHLRMHRFLDQQARPRGAHFALAVEDPRLRAAHGSLQIGIGEDDVRTLAAQLERDALVRLRGHLHDLPANLGGSRERDLVDIGMPHERGAGSGSSSTNDIKRPRRHASLERDLGKQQGRERRLRGRLQDDRAAGREGRGELPARDVEREVPRHNRPDDPDRLAERVRKEGPFDRKRGADDFVRPPRVVAERVDRHPDFDLRLEERLAVLGRLEPGDLIEPGFQ